MSPRFMTIAIRILGAVAAVALAVPLTFYHM